MLKHFAATLIVLAFAGQSLAGGFVCDESGAYSDAEMACCKQAKSPTGSTAAILCCQVVCGELTDGWSGPQSNAARHPQQVPAPVIVAKSVFQINLLFPGNAPVKSADALRVQHSPPALYLHNSSFLI